MSIGQIIDLDRYPLHQPDNASWLQLVHECQQQLAHNGMFNLPGLLLPDASQIIIDELQKKFEQDDMAFTHQREHNIYFNDKLDHLPTDHPALRRLTTSNRTLCADQLPGSALIKLYQWKGLRQFLSAVLGLQSLYTMADPLAQVNVMSYHEPQTLNWHFDRSEFTTTLLLQAPLLGGEFEYAKDLRSEGNPNYDGVAALLKNEIETRKLALHAGTLNVFRGRNTAHRVTPIVGQRPRIIAVFSYFEQPEVCFTEAERLGFYGRSR